ncbi:Ribonuclease H-like superfamily protein [Rhynchospora pubera]|uniref:Ribonuclease H-like superfamily protein n=1 Tax=Rhynchospora pubera TaxID=906938 RepID=A0AAV8EA41_9POAL|nr:Ribonuclease H-like superfamily protein [Rhynchospora pubera]
MRSSLKDHIQWLIGPGNTIPAFDQPWHPMWQSTRPKNASQRRLFIKDLIQAETNTWNTGKLVQHFGFGMALFIVHTYPRPPILLHISDRLVFTHATNGQFTLKKAYHLLENQYSTDPIDKLVWLIIWRDSGALPRIQMFVWKAMLNSLPLGATFAARLRRQTHACALCGLEEDSALHALFLCQRARAVWLASPLGLRTDQLPTSFREVLNFVCQTLQLGQVLMFLNILWAYWKCRCSKIYDGRKFTVQSVLTMAMELNRLSDISYFGKRSLVRQPHVQDCVIPSNQGTVCYLDGSYRAEMDAAWAYIIFKDGMLVQYGAHSGQANSPFQAEVKAMVAAIQAVHTAQLNSCTFYTDCATLQHVISMEGPPLDVEWTSYQYVFELWRHFRKNVEYICKNISRDDNVEAHNLANYARRKNLSCLDFTFPLFPPLDM